MKTTVCMMEKNPFTVEDVMKATNAPEKMVSKVVEECCEENVIMDYGDGAYGAM